MIGSRPFYPKETISWGWLLGVRILPPEVFLPLISECAIATWFLQWMLRPHEPGQVRLDLKNVLWPSLWLTFQLILVKGFLGTAEVGYKEWPKHGKTNVLPLFLPVRLPLALVLLYHLPSLWLDGSAVVSP